MMTFGARLREARLAKGFTQKQLASMVGVKNTSISNWEKDQNRPDPDTIELLCGALDISANDLLPSTRQNNKDTNEVIFAWGRPILTAYKSAAVETQRAACAVLSLPHIIPSAAIAPRVREMIVYSYPAAAGLPLYAESDYERVEVLEEAVPCGADFGIRISGTSMEPTISDGSIVWVHKQSDIRDGDIGIFMLADSAVCKRARLDWRGRIKLLDSDNPEYKPITGSDLEELRIVGKVLP